MLSPAPTRLPLAQCSTSSRMPSSSRRSTTSTPTSWRKSIDRLADLTEAQLALEKQRLPMLQSLVVNQGSLSSLTTMPATFSGGTFVGGSGLNANPDTNTVSINIGTITGQSLTKAQIEKIMYDVFSKALADAAKL